MRTRRATVALLTSLTLCWPQTLLGIDLTSAEGSDVRLTAASDVGLFDVDTGARVETLTGGQSLRARLALAEREALLLRLDDGRRVRVERAALLRLEQRVPGTIGRRAGRGALIGGGAGVGFIVLAASTAKCTTDDYCDAGIVVLAASVFAAMGAAIGAVIGAVTGREAHWRDLFDARPPSGSNTTGQPRLPAGPRFGLSVRF